MEQTARVLADVAAERVRQRERWGEQTLDDGTGGKRREQERDGRRRVADLFAELGTLTWRHVLEEEVAEALAETDDCLLRAELVQVAAVAVQWIEALDRRSKVE